MSEDVLLVERDGPVTVLTLNRPRSRNALDPALLAALDKGLAAAAEDPGSRGRGGDRRRPRLLRGRRPQGRHDGGRQPLREARRHHRPLPRHDPRHRRGAQAGDRGRRRRRRRLRLRPGPRLRSARALGGRLPPGEIRQDRPHARRGRHLLAAAPGGPGAGARDDAARRADPGRGGALAGARQPGGAGGGALREEAMGLAHRLAKGPPIALAQIKRAVRAGLGGTIEEALGREKEGQIRCLRSADCLEGWRPGCRRGRRGSRGSKGFRTGAADRRR